MNIHMYKPSLVETRGFLHYKSTALSYVYIYYTLYVWCLLSPLHNISYHFCLQEPLLSLIIPSPTLEQLELLEGKIEQKNKGGNIKMGPFIVKNNP